MAFVVCEPCHDCKYTDCVTVCPCDCFYQDDMQLYIDQNTASIARPACPNVQWAPFSTKAMFPSRGHVSSSSMPNDPLS